MLDFPKIRYRMSPLEMNMVFMKLQKLQNPPKLVFMLLKVCQKKTGKFSLKHGR